MTDDLNKNNPAQALAHGVRLAHNGGGDIPVLAVIAMPGQAVGASYNQIEATIMDPRNAHKILKGLAVMAHRQLNKPSRRVDPRLMAAALLAVRADEARIT
jgi:hypothetical protein